MPKSKPADGLKSGAKLSTTKEVKSEGSTRTVKKTKLNVESALDSVKQGKARLDQFFKKYPEVIEKMIKIGITIEAKPFRDSFYYEITHTPTGKKERIMGAPVFLSDQKVARHKRSCRNISLPNGEKSTIFFVVDGYETNLSDLIKHLHVTPVGAHSSGNDQFGKVFEGLGLEEAIVPAEQDKKYVKLIIDFIKTLTGIKPSGYIHNDKNMGLGETYSILMNTIDGLGDAELIITGNELGIMMMGMNRFMSGIKLGGFQVLARPILD